MTSDQRVRRRVVVGGRVQGVFFRDTCRSEAERLGVAGSARNLSDGRVEVVAEGRAYDVDRLIAWCRRGPDGARVDGLEVTDEPPKDERGFAIR